MVHNTARMHFREVSNRIETVSNDQLNEKQVRNEALPPLWQYFKALDDKMQFQDNVLVMVSNNRTLP